MDDGSSSSILILIFLIVIHAIISLFYAALINTRRAQLHELQEAGDTRADRIIALLEGRSDIHTTTRLVVTLIRFAIATIAAVNLALPLFNAEPTPLPGAGVGLLLLVALVTLILGDIVPEGIGTAHADSLALWSAYPMRLMVQILRPVVVVLLWVSRLISSLFGTAEVMNTVTEEEIMTLVNAGHTGGTIDEEEKDMIYSVLQLDQTLAREAMTPRMDIIAVDINTGIDEALKTFMDSGFSRIPVYEDNIDNIAGLLYVKDLLTLWHRQKDQLDSDKSVRDLIRPAFFVPETKRADVLLKDLQNRKVHMAIVVDEYGGTAGLVTIENLIEEIVGDIRDEYDVNEEAEYMKNGAGEYIVDAGIDLDDLNELLDLNLEAEDADTLGGYIFSVIGRVPVVKEVIETDLVTLEIRSIDGRRIRKVRVTPKAPETVDEKPDEPKEEPDDTE